MSEAQSRVNILMQIEHVYQKKGHLMENANQLKSKNENLKIN